MRFALSGHWVGRSKNESRRSSTDPSIWLLLANPASSGSRQTAWGDSGRCSGAPYRKLNSFYFVPRKRKEKEVEDEGHAKPKASCGQKVLPQTRTPSSSFWVGGAEYWVNHRRDGRAWRTSRTTSANQFNTKARHKEEGASKESSGLQKSIHVRTSFISAFTNAQINLRDLDLLGSTAVPSRAGNRAPDDILRDLEAEARTLPLLHRKICDQLQLLQVEEIVLKVVYFFHVLL